MKTIEILQNVRKNLDESEKVIFDNALNNVLTCAKHHVKSRIIMNTKVSKCRLEYLNFKPKDILLDLKTLNTYSNHKDINFDESDFKIAETQMVNIIREVVEDR